MLVVIVVKIPILVRIVKIVNSSKKQQKQKRNINNNLDINERKHELTMELLT